MSSNGNPETLLRECEILKKKYDDACAESGKIREALDAAKDKSKKALRDWESKIRELKSEIDKR